ncbi:MAG: hypothetical protein E6J27_03545 [Chloroflexi bacterium]|nr:MAG: hypothetical protein E6J27_03545 [Chloroflexota bacterium]
MIAASDRRRNRARLVAYERSIRNSSPTHSRQIRRHNLGRRKQVRVRSCESSRLRDFVNRSLNELFHDTGILRMYAEDLTFRPGWPGRAINRRLGRWLKGYLHHRLMHKAELNGVELQTVNAAYTSQTCPRCWFASRGNRRGDRFRWRIGRAWDSNEASFMHQGASRTWIESRTVAGGRTRPPVIHTAALYPLAAAAESVTDGSTFTA